MDRRERERRRRWYRAVGGEGLGRMLPTGQEEGAGGSEATCCLSSALLRHTSAVTSASAAVCALPVDFADLS